MQAGRAAEARSGDICHSFELPSQLSLPNRQFGMGALLGKEEEGVRTSLAFFSSQWTTEDQLEDAISRSIPIRDLLDLRVNETRRSGQSKGYAVVALGSDESGKLLVEQLTQLELNGHRPTVDQFSMRALNELNALAIRNGLVLSCTKNMNDVFKRVFHAGCIDRPDPRGGLSNADSTLMRPPVAMVPIVGCRSDSVPGWFNNNRGGGATVFPPPRVPLIPSLRMQPPVPFGMPARPPMPSVPISPSVAANLAALMAANGGGPLPVREAYFKTKKGVERTYWLPPSALPGSLSLLHVSSNGQWSVARQLISHYAARSSRTTPSDDGHVAVATANASASSSRWLRAAAVNARPGEHAPQSGALSTALTKHQFVLRRQY